MGKCSIYHREHFLCEDDFRGECQRGFKLELASCPPAFPNEEPQMEKLTRSPHLLANSRPAKQPKTAGIGPILGGFISTNGRPGMVVT